MPVTASQTCPGDFPSSQFYNSDGSRKPLIASGYYSDRVIGSNYGKLQPLTTLDLWSYACPASGWHTDAYREGFCNNLKDAAGNIISNPPPCCGGTGPEILNYNVVDQALQDVAPDAQALASQYDVSAKVKQLITIGVVLFIVILISGIIWVA